MLKSPTNSPYISKPNSSTHITSQKPPLSVQSLTLLLLNPVSKTSFLQWSSRLKSQILNKEKKISLADRTSIKSLLPSSSLIFSRIFLMLIQPPFFKIPPLSSPLRLPRRLLMRLSNNSLLPWILKKRSTNPERFTESWPPKVRCFTSF